MGRTCIFYVVYKDEVKHVRLHLARFGWCAPGVDYDPAFSCRAGTRLNNAIKAYLDRLEGVVPLGSQEFGCTAFTGMLDYLKLAESDAAKYGIED